MAEDAAAAGADGPLVGAAAAVALARAGIAAGLRFSGAAPLDVEAAVLLARAARLAREGRAAAGQVQRQRQGLRRRAYTHLHEVIPIQPQVATKRHYHRVGCQKYISFSLHAETTPTSRLQAQPSPPPGCPSGRHRCQCAKATPTPGWRQQAA